MSIQNATLTWLLPEPVVDGVDGAGFGAVAIGGAGLCGGAEPVVPPAATASLLAVVSLTWPRVNTNISTSASTTAPATQPHMALEDSSSFKRCERMSSSCSGGGSISGIPVTWIGHGGLPGLVHL